MAKNREGKGRSPWQPKMERRTQQIVSPSYMFKWRFDLKIDAFSEPFIASCVPPTLYANEAFCRVERRVAFLRNFGTFAFHSATTWLGEPSDGWKRSNWMKTLTLIDVKGATVSYPRDQGTTEPSGGAKINLSKKQFFPDSSANLVEKSPLAKEEHGHPQLTMRNSNVVQGRITCSNRALWRLANKGKLVLSPSVDKTKTKGAAIGWNFGIGMSCSASSSSSSFGEPILRLKWSASNLPVRTRILTRRWESKAAADRRQWSQEHSAPGGIAESS